jgi:hypothetical protein
MGGQRGSQPGVKLTGFWKDHQLLPYQPIGKGKLPRSAKSLRRSIRIKRPTATRRTMLVEECGEFSAIVHLSTSPTIPLRDASRLKTS